MSKNIPARILIVEDSPLQREVLRRALDCAGYDVISAVDGKDGLVKAKEMLPELIVSDIMMPGMNGFELCQAVKADEGLRDIPLIILTSLSDMEDVLYGVESGADRYVTKPFNEKYLLEKVEQLLANPPINEWMMPKEVIEVSYSDEKRKISASPKQILNLLLSTYENAAIQNQDLIDAKGKLEAMNQDLTKNLLALRLSEERFETLVQTIPDVVYKINSDGEFTFVNYAVKRFGYEPGELLGRHFSEIIVPPDLARVSRNKIIEEIAGTATGDKDGPKLFDERRTGERKTTGLEVNLIAKGSESKEPALIESMGENEITVEVNSSGLYESNPAAEKSNFIGTVGVIRDITDRKLAEEELHRLNEALAAKEKLTLAGQLGGHIAHDLRNPIGVIANSAYYLNMKLKGTDEKIGKHLEILTHEVKRANNIISEMLDFYKIRPPDFKEVDINSLIGETIENVSTTENIKVTTNYDNDLSKISIDPDQISRVLINLLSNAVDAMPDGGTLEASTSLRRGLCEITVSDTGMGIPKENYRKIFEPLFTSKMHGIGLGLSIVNDLVEKNNGTIEFKSAEGKGTAFTLLLPLKREEDGIIP